MLINSDAKEDAQVYLPKGQETRIALCEKVLSTYSPSGGEGEMAGLLHSELLSSGLDPAIDGAGNVICSIGSGSRSVLLCPHMDTVPGEIPVRREGNMIYGRGACDAKGALLSMLFAFEDLAFEIKNNSRTGRIIFAAVTEEETGSTGLNELIKNKILADAAIFGEPGGVNRVTVGYRGHVPTTIEVRTREAHGSAPWLGNNAAEVAFSIYLKTKALWPSDGRADTGRVSVALTQFHSGSVHNVTPGKAVITLDIRVPLGIQTEEIISKIRSLISSSSRADVHTAVTFGVATEPYRTELDSNLFRAINRTLIKSGFAKPEFVTKSGTGDMNTYALTFGADAITYGPGDTKLSHTNEERVGIEEIFACSKILFSSVLEFFSLFERNR